MKKSKLKQARKVAMLLSASLLIEQPALMNPVLYVHAQEDTSIACDLEESVTEAEVEDSTAEITSEDSENEAIVETTDETSEEVEVTKETDETEASEEVTTAEAEEVTTAEAEEESKEEKTEAVKTTEVAEATEKDEESETINSEKVTLTVDDTTESETESATDEATTNESENLTTESITTQDTITNDAIVEDIDILEAEGDPSSSDVTKRFTDIPAGEWYVDAVQFVSDQKIMNGVSDYTFAPKMTLTREQFITVLYNMEGAPETTFKQIFDDVKDATSWYAKSVTWASENKITSGIGDGKFGTGAEITREQLATLLYNYTQQKDKNKLTINQDAVAEFPDATQISDWASEGMKWAVTNGVMKGKAGNDGKNHLDPGGKASRAECAQMIKNFVDANGGEEQQEHNYQDGSAIIKVEGFDQKDSMVVTDEKITLKGTVSNADEVSEFTCSKHSAADETVKALDVNGVVEWTAKDITLDIGTNYITFVVKNNKGEEFMKEVRIIRDSTVLKAADNVVSFNVNDEKQLKDVEQIYEQILDVWKDDKDTETTDDDEICIAVNETNPLLGYIQKGNIKPGDVVFIPENDYFITGFTKIYRSHDDKAPSAVEGYDSSKYEVIHMSEASILDLIDGDISINLNEIDQNDPIAFVYNPYSDYLQDGPEVLAGGKNEFFFGVDSDVQGPGIQYQNLAKLSTSYELTSPMKLSFGYSDMIIYDADGEEDTKNDRILIDGKMEYSDINPTIGLEWHPDVFDNVLPNQLISTLEYNETQTFKITAGADVMPDKIPFADFENKREELLFGIIDKVEGVDTGKTIFLGAFGLHIGGKQATVGIQDISNESFTIGLNPVLVIALIIDVNGEIKADLSVGYTETSYVKKGFNVQQDGFKGAYGTVEQNMGTDNRKITIPFTDKVYHINTYDIKQKSKNESGEPERVLTFAMEGSVDLYAGFGDAIGVMVCGIMPAVLKGTIGPKLKATADFNCTISNYEFNNAIEMLGHYVKVVGNVIASAGLVARIKLDVNLTAEAGGESYTLKYTHEPPLDIELSPQFKFSTTPVNGYVYQQDYDEDESNNVPIAGATVTLTDKFSIEPKTYTTTTDENGYYEFGLMTDKLAGNYFLTVSQTGYKDYNDNKFTVESGNNEPNKIYMERKYNTTFGTVTIGRGSNVNDYKDAFIKKVIIESDDAIVGENPFQGSLIQEVEIMDGVTYIPEGLFSEAVIRKISIPDSLTHIRKKAFYKAKLPKDFEIGSNIIMFGTECFNYAYIGSASVIFENVEFIGSKAFGNCKVNEMILSKQKMFRDIWDPFNNSTIEKVIISDTVTYIPSELFQNATVKDIKIPDSVTELGDWAFYEAILPRDFKMGKGIQVIGYSCFYNTDLSNTKVYMTDDIKVQVGAFQKCKLKELEISFTKNINYSNVFEFATIDKVSITDTTTVIPQGIFMRATIHNIKIPDTVERIERAAFVSTKLPDDFSVPEKVTLVGEPFDCSTYKQR